MRSSIQFIRKLSGILGVEETVIWANSEQLPYTFLDVLVDKQIDGASIHV